MKILCKFFVKINICSVNHIFTKKIHPQIPDFQISQPNIVLSLQTIHQWKTYSFGFQMMYKFKKITCMTGFVVQGHILFIPQFVKTNKKVHLQ